MLPNSAAAHGGQSSPLLQARGFTLLQNFGVLMFQLPHLSQAVTSNPKPITIAARVRRFIRMPLVSGHLMGKPRPLPDDRHSGSFDPEKPPHLPLRNFESIFVRRSSR
jgi:hypothetical protein